MYDAKQTGCLIASEIKKTGAKQKEFAASAGITEFRLSQICNGKSRMYFDEAVKLAERLNCSVDYLIGRAS